MRTMAKLLLVRRSQRQVTKYIMHTWTLHAQMLRNPPTDRRRDVHMLHHTQSVPMLDATSALRGNMPQHNDDEGSKQPRLSFSPAASVWGKMGRATTTLPSLLLRTCHAPVICISWVVKVSGTTSTPASTMLLIGPAHTTMYCGRWNDLLVDVTIRHNFKGTGHNGQTQGQIRNPDNPDHILESAAADKIRNYGDTYRRNRHVAFLPASMSTSGRIHGELLRFIFFMSNKQAEDLFEALGYQPHSQEFCHRRGVFFQQSRGTGMACAQTVALRGAPTTARRHVAAPRRPPPLHMAYDDHDRNVNHIHGFAYAIYLG
jgi:hypothetical protein